ncbi:MAG: acetyl-CoA synthetase [Flavobacteriales bacterium]|jgi:acetyl-CoA synthetase
MRIQSELDYQEKYKLSIDQPEEFWESIADEFIWKKKWDTVLEFDLEKAEVTWFKGAKTNITINCLDRYAESQPNKTAILWEPNDPNQKSLSYSYKELTERVCQFGNMLRAKGVVKGDRVCLYMPMIPDLAVAVLACARIGAIHSVVFAGFSAQALADRINDAACKVIITADGLFRGEKQLNLKAIVDEAMKNCSSIQHVLLARVTNEDIAISAERDVFYQYEIDQFDKVCEPEIMDAEDPLFILYTSGSTGKPKGVVHTCGGYMVYAKYSFENVFQYNADDVYWCTADIGWVTGHSYIVYGPLLAGATTLMFEGIPSYPNASRFWEVCEKYKVNQFYTAPTAIRALMACGDEFVTPFKLESLKVIGTVGEPINEEAWHWYNKHVGKYNCPIVDTWWQTETGGIMISSLGEIGPQIPSYAGRPLPGIQPVLLSAEGVLIEDNEVEGLLCIKYPWPSMIRTTWGDHQRCISTYFSAFKGYYFTGDGARRNANGNLRIIGRVDDVINVSGHRFGTAEIENAINEYEGVVESAVVGFPHNIKGQGIYAFVICHAGFNAENISQGIIKAVEKGIGKIAKPDKIQIVPGLPKTRSGKIMRRILRKIADGSADNLGDTSTLLDPEVVEVIKKGLLS